MHILQLLGGNPSLCSNSTRPSWELTNLPSNWRIQRCNRRARKRSCSPRPGSGNPCHEPDSTTPSWELTSPPANSRIRPRNCRDQLELVVASVGRKCGGFCSTTAAWLGPRRSTVRRRSCRGRLVLRVQAALWVAGGAVASSEVAWEVG